MSQCSVRNDPFVKQLVAKLPSDAAATFSDEQFVALKAALGGRSWGAHAIDLRWALSFWHWHYYIVFLAGRNRRELSRRESEVKLVMASLFMAGLITICTLFGLLVLYLIKSALGIDLIPGYSFGIWDWFKAEFL